MKEEIERENWKQRRETQESKSKGGRKEEMKEEIEREN